MFSILMSVSFVAAISIILYYNAAVDISTFEQVPGIERSNAVLGLAPEQDADDFAELILAQTGVVDAQYLDQGRITLNDRHVSAIVMDDYSRRVTQNLHDGIFPRHDNEIAISAILARDLDKDIGDEVLLGDEYVRFIIVGLSQGMETGDARGVYLTRGGIDRVNPDFFRMSLMVYLEDGVDVDAFIEDMEESYPDYVRFGANIDTAFAEGVSGFASVFAAIGVGILAVSSFVIVLILYFVIGSTVIKQHRDLGVKKAIGYTTANLMSQVSLSFALPVVLGTVIGCTLGAVLLNTIMSVGMAEMGVTSANYLVNAGWVAGTGIFIAVLAYAVSTLVTLRIRKISAYSLIVE